MVADRSEPPYMLIEGINHSLHRFVVAQVARAIAIDKLAGLLPVLPARPKFFFRIRHINVHIVACSIYSNINKSACKLTELSVV